MSASFKTCCVQKGFRANVSVERVGRRHGRREKNNSFNTSSNNKKSNTVRIINDGFRRQRVRVKVTSAAGTTGNGDDDDETIKVILKVPDMMCEGCAESVTNALESSDSFSSSSTVKGEISIDLETKLVTVSVRGCTSAVEGLGKIPEFVQALKENGFDSEPVFD
jgi:copper chaperone CopZ